jgi:hypothetical protein
MAIIRKYWGYLVEVNHVTFRKSKASENLGVFMGAAWGVSLAAFGAALGGA